MSLSSVHYSSPSNPKAALFNEYSHKRERKKEEYSVIYQGHQNMAHFVDIMSD